ncbi:MAG: hypothetical protein IPK19_20005 [Chloroflexi bacterium]|nr:hypothetical protein [Chloroflexota bacterium]
MVTQTAAAPATSSQIPAPARILALAAVLLAAFALRVGSLQAADLNIDESWSYVHSYYIAYPADFSLTQILAPEPNNALHLLLASAFLRMSPNSLGIRLLSVLAGVCVVALSARLAFRLSGSSGLYGRRAALLTAGLTACAVDMAAQSQIARPYMLAAMFALLAVVGGIETAGG